MQIYEHIEHPCTTLHLTGSAPKATDTRAIQTYEDAEAVLHEAVQIQQHLAAQDAVLGQLIAAAKAAAGHASDTSGSAGAIGTVGTAEA